jgi:hypothetical protein
MSNNITQMSSDFTPELVLAHSLYDIHRALTETRHILIHHPEFVVAKRKELALLYQEFTKILQALRHEKLSYVWEEDL